MADQDFNIKVITTADTSGLRQTQAEIQKVRQQAEAPIAEKASASFTRAFTGAGGLGYLVARVINGIAEETNKVTAELDKQGDHIVALSQKWTDMAQAATSAEDIAKISASGVKEIEALSKAINKAANPEFSLGASVVDNLVKRFMNLGRETEDALGPNEELAKALFEGLQLDQQQVIDLNARAIELGRTFQASFEKRQAESLADALAEVADEMAKAKNEQDGLTGAMLKTRAGIDRYNELAVTLANLTRQTDLLTQADARRQRQADEASKASAKRQSEADSFMANALKTSDPNVQRVLMNEAAARRGGPDADMFTKSAQAYERGLGPQQREELEGLRGAGDQKLTDAISDLNKKMDRYWGP